MEVVFTAAAAKLLPAAPLQSPAQPTDASSAHACTSVPACMPVLAQQRSDTSRAAHVSGCNAHARRVAHPPSCSARGDQHSPALLSTDGQLAAMTPVRQRAPIHESVHRPQGTAATTVAPAGGSMAVAFVTAVRGDESGALLSRIKQMAITNDCPTAAVRAERPGSTPTARPSVDVVARSVPVDAPPTSSPRVPHVLLIEASPQHVPQVVPAHAIDSEPSPEPYAPTVMTARSTASVPAPFAYAPHDRHFVPVPPLQPSTFERLARPPPRWSAAIRSVCVRTAVAPPPRGTSVRVVRTMPSGSGNVRGSAVRSSSQLAPNVAPPVRRLSTGRAASSSALRASTVPSWR
ncbi:hypothetical protein EON66_01740 [archaeon]|nr:MAG: hypothetical protein EON66_01740 [archaeon]